MAGGAGGGNALTEPRAGTGGARPTTLRAGCNMSTYFLTSKEGGKRPQAQGEAGAAGLLER